MYIELDNISLYTFFLIAEMREYERRKLSNSPADLAAAPIRTAGIASAIHPKAATKDKTFAR